MNHSSTTRLLFWACLAAGAGAFSPPAWSADDAFDPASLRPFTAGVPYLGEYETGLYPGGTNEMPAAHRRAGERLAAAIRPLDADGNPDEQRGRILALVLGHSNCRDYFNAFRGRLDERKAELHPRFELFNAAGSAQILQNIATLKGGVWDNAERFTRRPGYSAKQVQVLFLHPTYHRASRARSRAELAQGEFPDSMRQMQRDLAKVLEHAVRQYPNLKIAYLTSDGYRHYTGLEPHVFQEAFAIKWLIESQIKQEPGTAYEGQDRELPWLQWGPYIWDNTWSRAEYFPRDGVHPGPRATAVFVEKYWQHLDRDSVARPWFLTGAR